MCTCSSMARVPWELGRALSWQFMFAFKLSELGLAQLPRVQWSTTWDLMSSFSNERWKCEKELNMEKKRSIRVLCVDHYTLAWALSCLSKYWFDYGHLSIFVHTRTFTLKIILRAHESKGELDLDGEKQFCYHIAVPIMNDKLSEKLFSHTLSYIEIYQSRTILHLILKRSLFQD